MTTQRLVRTALATALSTVILLLAILLPGVLTVPASVVWPVTPLYIYRKQGGRDAMALLAATAVLGFLFAGLSAVVYIAVFGPLTLYFGWAAGRGWSGEATLVRGVLLTTLLVAGGLEFSKKLLGIDYVARSQETAEGSLGPLQMAVPESLIVAAFAGAGLILTILIYVAAKVVLEYLHVSMPDLPGFEHWRLPRWAGIAFVGVLVAYFLWPLSHIPDPAYLWSTTFLVYMILLIGNGAAALYWILLRWNMPRPAAGALVTIISLLPLVNYLVLLFGLIEALVQRRRAIVQRKAKWYKQSPA